jgi:hypothetical protein
MGWLENVPAALYNILRSRLSLAPRLDALAAALFATQPLHKLGDRSVWLFAEPGEDAFGQSSTMTTGETLHHNPLLHHAHSTNTISGYGYPNVVFGELGFGDLGFEYPGFGDPAVNRIHLQVAEGPMRRTTSRPGAARIFSWESSFCAPRRPALSAPRSPSLSSPAKAGRPAVRWVRNSRRAFLTAGSPATQVGFSRLGDA